MTIDSVIISVWLLDLFEYRGDKFLTSRDIGVKYRKQFHGFDDEFDVEEFLDNKTYKTWFTNFEKFFGFSIVYDANQPVETVNHQNTSRRNTNWSPTRDDLTTVMGGYHIDDEFEELSNFDKEYDLDDNENYSNGEHVPINHPIVKWLLSSISELTLLASNINIRDYILVDSTSDSKYLATILNAISEKKVITIDYQKYGEESHKVTGEPLFVKMVLKRWYLYLKVIEDEKNVCIDYTKNEVHRIYALDRIKGVTIEESKFKRPRFDLMKGIEEDYCGIYIDDKIEKQQIFFDILENKIPYFESLPIHRSQKKCKGSKNRYSINIRPTSEFYRGLLRHGTDIKIVEPFKARKEMVRRSANLFKSYYVEEGVTYQNSNDDANRRIEKLLTICQALNLDWEERCLWNAIVNSALIEGCESTTEMIKGLFRNGDTSEMSEKCISIASAYKTIIDYKTSFVPFHKETISNLNNERVILSKKVYDSLINKMSEWRTYNDKEDREYGDLYAKSFEAHHYIARVEEIPLGIRNIIARLTMHGLQYEYGLVPITIPTDEIGNYCDIIQSEDCSSFIQKMMDIAIKCLKSCISTHVNNL